MFQSFGVIGIPTVLEHYLTLLDRVINMKKVNYNLQGLKILMLFFIVLCSHESYSITCNQLFIQQPSIQQRILDSALPGENIDRLLQYYSKWHKALREHNPYVGTLIDAEITIGTNRLMRYVTVVSQEGSAFDFEIPLFLEPEDIVDLILQSGENREQLLSALVLKIREFMHINDLEYDDIVLSGHSLIESQGIRELAIGLQREESHIIDWGNSIIISLFNERL
jgi:hypothetical protein